MKPNGRRAWRQRAKRKRWEYYNCWLLIKRHRWIVEPDAADPVIQVKPFAPRSLVGMSEGAKKRAARLEVAWCDLRGAGYRQSRSKYRIGQRLRPCPGCCACKSKRLTRKQLKKAGHGLLACWFGNRESWICGPMVITDKIRQDDPMHQTRWHCDGSGVLPAKRSGVAG